MTAPDVVDFIGSKAERPTLLLNHNLHSAFLYRSEDWYREFYDRATRIIIDGFPILVLAGLRRTPSFRVGSTDWLARLGNLENDRGDSPYRIFVFGGTEEVNARAQVALRQRSAELSVVGHHGYLASKSDELEVVERMRDFRPDLVLVGLGMPRQEQFILNHFNQLPPAYYATVGGAIDYVAGASVLAPRWIGAVGFEWLWRLLNDPRRLARRYLIEPFALAWIVIFRRP